MVRALQEGRSRTLKLTIVRQRDKLEIVFKVTSSLQPLTTVILTVTYFQHFLCEDRSASSESNFSYVDFLCHMHKEIRAMLS